MHKLEGMVVVYFVLYLAFGFISVTISFYEIGNLLFISVLQRGPKYSELPTSAAIANLLGYCLMIFAGLVVYMVATPQFRRRMLPEEIQLQLERQSPTNWEVKWLEILYLKPFVL